MVSETMAGVGYKEQLPFHPENSVRKLDGEVVKRMCSGHSEAFDKHFA